MAGSDCRLFQAGALQILRRSPARGARRTEMSMAEIEMTEINDVCLDMSSMMQLQAERGKVKCDLLGVLCSVYINIYKVRPGLY